MAGPWPLLLLALGCPALPAGVRATPFPSLAPPITLLVDGKPQTLVVCLVLDVAPPGLDSPIWFSAGNGSLLDAFTYGPSPAADGTWTGLAQLSLPSKELAAWEPLVCHTGPGAGRRGWSTQPLQLSGDASSVRTCIPEPVRGMRSRALRLAALRLLLFKLLLFDVLLTCSRLRALRAAPTDPARRLPRGARGSPRGRGPRGPTAFSSRRLRRSRVPASTRWPSPQGRRDHAQPRDRPDPEPRSPGAQAWAGRRRCSPPTEPGPGARVICL